MTKNKLITAQYLKELKALPISYSAELQATFDRVKGYKTSVEFLIGQFLMGYLGGVYESDTDKDYIYDIGDTVETTYNLFGQYIDIVVLAHGKSIYVGYERTDDDD